MKIVVLEGSPNRKGSTHILADCFRQGAEEAGHTVELIDVTHDADFKLKMKGGVIFAGQAGRSGLFHSIKKEVSKWPMKK